MWRGPNPEASSTAERDRPGADLVTPVTTSRSDDATTTTRPDRLLRTRSRITSSAITPGGENSTRTPRPGGRAVATAAPSNTTVTSAEVRAASAGQRPDQPVPLVGEGQLRDSRSW